MEASGWGGRAGGAGVARRGQLSASRPNWGMSYVALIGGEETIDERVIARLARQDIFARKPLPTISFAIEESVLTRPVGGEGVMRGQLEQLLLCGERRSVDIQVMPNKREEHAGLAGPFTLIETKEGRRIAYVEAYKHSRLYTDRRTVRELEEQYGLLRAQALTPRESLALIEKLLGET